MPFQSVVPFGLYWNEPTYLNGRVEYGFDHWVSRSEWMVPGLDMERFDAWAGLSEILLDALRAA